MVRLSIVSTGPFTPYMESSRVLACVRAGDGARVRKREGVCHASSLGGCVCGAASGGDSRQAIQSVGLHLVRLCMFLERGLSPEAANEAMLRAGKMKSKMFKLARPASLGDVTVADVLAAQGMQLMRVRYGAGRSRRGGVGGPSCDSSGLGRLGVAGSARFTTVRPGVPGVFANALRYLRAKGGGRRALRDLYQAA